MHYYLQQDYVLDSVCLVVTSLVKEVMFFGSVGVLVRLFFYMLLILLKTVMNGLRENFVEEFGGGERNK